MRRPEGTAVIGWDIGGAHVKACLLQGGRVVDVEQWACPLWQGMVHLERVLQRARHRWPALATARHAVTMTGEMTDLFENREDGVRRIAALLSEALVPGNANLLHFYGGYRQWFTAAEAGSQWQRIASANWLATASHAAECMPEGVLIDIGSTTTDIIAFRAGRVLTASRTDAQRLATGELVYQGVVRTPLCALGPRIAWRGEAFNIMNELFATTADVYRVTAELNPAHDLQPSADNAPKDLPATRRRLARMIGLDARDASIGDWLAFAQAWRARQVDELASQLRRVVQAHGLTSAARAVSAGCGDFLAEDVVASAGVTFASLQYGSAVAPMAAQTAANSGDSDASGGNDGSGSGDSGGSSDSGDSGDSGDSDDSARNADQVRRLAQVCAPSVAVAALFDRDPR